MTARQWSSCVIFVFTRSLDRADLADVELSSPGTRKTTPPTPSVKEFQETIFNSAFFFSHTLPYVSNIYARFFYMAGIGAEFWIVNNSETIALR